MERPARGHVLVVTTRTTREAGDRWLTPWDVVQKLGVRRGTLDGWRFQKKGPPWERIEGRICYKLSAFNEWLATQIQPLQGQRFRLRHKGLPSEK